MAAYGSMAVGPTPIEAISSKSDEDEGHQTDIGTHITVTSVHGIETSKEQVTVCFDLDFFIKAIDDPADVQVQMDCGR